MEESNEIIENEERDATPCFRYISEEPQEELSEEEFQQVIRDRIDEMISNSDVETITPEQEIQNELLYCFAISHNLSEVVQNIQQLLGKEVVALWQENFAYQLILDGSNNTKLRLASEQSDEIYEDYTIPVMHILCLLRGHLKYDELCYRTGHNQEHVFLPIALQND